MRGPNTTSLQFLRSDAGREFTQTLVAQYIASAHRLDDGLCVPETAEVRFGRLLDDFVSVLKTREVPFEPTFREELAEVYRERFFDLYPKDDKDSCIYYLILAGVTKILAEMTVNVWRLERGDIGVYPNRKPGRPFLFLHLQWAREAFGWWAANLAHLNYELHYERPCKLDPVLAAMLENLGDATQSELALLKPRELENGCPVC